jgi:hypothetical protein
MRQNNPMQDPAVREKVRKAVSGRTFLSRGGNGQLTEPQKLLARRLGLPMEYVILTAPVRGQFPSLPKHYKVDLADPARMLAIEVDGNSHNTRKWRFLDRRKTEILNALGWSVLRFSNQRVVQNTDEVVEQIQSFTISR